MNSRITALCTRGPSAHGMARSLALIAAFAVSAVTGAAAQEVQTARAQASSSSSSTQLYASPSQIQLVQERLRESGFDPRSTSGVWDEATETAVREFQKDNGFAVTGQLDTSLLSALEIGDVLEGETEEGGFLDGLLDPDVDERQAASGEGAPIFVSPSHIAQIQFLLREKGHYSGEIDGVWGESTAQAAKQFREARGLEANDGIDIALLQALNSGREAPQIEQEFVAQSGAPLQVGAATVRELQRQLTEQGHETGSVDGKLGDNTREAIREFQNANALEATGTLTLPTLAALGVDVTDATQPESFEARAREDAIETEEAPDAVATADEQD